MIGKLLFGAVLAAGVGYGYPLWSEGTHSTCQALEKRFIGMAAPDAATARPRHALEMAVLRSYVEPLSSGRIAAAEMKQRYPALPPDLGCAVGYWTTLVDPRVETAVRQSMR